MAVLWIGGVLLGLAYLIVPFLISSRLLTIVKLLQEIRNGQTIGPSGQTGIASLPLRGEPGTEVERALRRPSK